MPPALHHLQRRLFLINLFICMLTKSRHHIDACAAAALRIWRRINDPFESGLIDHGTFAWHTGGNELGHFSLVQLVRPLLC